MRTGLPSADSTPGIARAARKPNIRSASIGARYASRSLITPGAAGSGPGGTPSLRDRGAWARLPRASRSCVGVAAKTSRIVALNCLMLAKPAAKAISDSGSSVVSVRMRAVWARCARAMASGPAPELGGDQAAYLPLLVAEAGGQSLDAAAVDDAVGDEPHRAPHHVGPDVPFR